MKKILIVEDDASVAKGLQARLNYAGYSTRVASDAIQGLQHATTFVPDLVLMDVNLPGGNGIDAAQRLRGILRTATPIVFLTASKQPGLLERATAVGSPVRFVEKPYEPALLLSAMRASLGEN